MKLLYKIFAFSLIALGFAFGSKDKNINTHNALNSVDFEDFVLLDKMDKKTKETISNCSDELKDFLRSYYIKFSIAEDKKCPVKSIALSGNGKFALIYYKIDQIYYLDLNDLTKIKFYKVSGVNSNVLGLSYDGSMGITAYNQVHIKLWYFKKMPTVETTLIPSPFELVSKTFDDKDDKQKKDKKRQDKQQPVFHDILCGSFDKNDPKFVYGTKNGVLKFIENIDKNVLSRFISAEKTTSNNDNLYDDDDPFDHIYTFRSYPFNDKRDILFVTTNSAKDLSLYQFKGYNHLTVKDKDDMAFNLLGPSEVTSANFSLDGNFIIATYKKNPKAAKIFNIKSVKEDVSDLNISDPDGINCGILSKDGSYFFTGSKDGIKYWTLNKTSLHGPIRATIGQNVTSICSSVDDKVLIYTVKDDSRVHIIINEIESLKLPVFNPDVSDNLEQLILLDQKNYDNIDYAKLFEDLKKISEVLPDYKKNYLIKKLAPKYLAQYLLKDRIETVIEYL